MGGEGAATRVPHGWSVLQDLRHRLSQSTNLEAAGRANACQWGLTQQQAMTAGSAAIFAARITLFGCSRCTPSTVNRSLTLSLPFPHSPATNTPAARCSAAAEPLACGPCPAHVARFPPYPFFFRTPKSNPFSLLFQVVLKVYCWQVCCFPSPRPAPPLSSLLALPSFCHPRLCLGPFSRHVTVT